MYWKKNCPYIQKPPIMWILNQMHRTKWEFFMFNLPLLWTTWYKKKIHSQYTHTRMHAYACTHACVHTHTHAHSLHRTHINSSEAGLSKVFLTLYEQDSWPVCLWRRKSHEIRLQSGGQASASLSWDMFAISVAHLWVHTHTHTQRGKL